MTTKNKTVAVYPGEGIGPEVVRVATRALSALRAPLELVPVELRPSHRDTAQVARLIADAGVLLKAPCDVEDSLESDPEWGDLFATYAKRYEFRTRPGVECPTKGGPAVDITLVRRFRDAPQSSPEARGDARAAQDDWQTCLRVHRYAFETARRRGKTHLLCAHSADLPTAAGGRFLESFREVAAEYPDIACEEVEAGRLSKRVVEAPHELSVIVAEEREGRMLAGLCAGLVGGLRHVPTTRKGRRVKVFQTHHGHASAIQGTGTANPTALVASSVMMLDYLGMPELARTLERALHDTLSEMGRSPDLGHAPPPFKTDRFEAILLRRLGWTDSTAAEARETACALQVGLATADKESAVRDRLRDLIPARVELTQLHPIRDGFRVRLEATEDFGVAGLLTLAGTIAAHQPVSSVTLLNTSPLSHAP